MKMPWRFWFLLWRVKTRAWLRRSTPTFATAGRFLLAWYAYLRLRFVALPVVRAVARFVEWVWRLWNPPAPRVGHDPIWLGRAKRGNRRGRSHWNYCR